MFARANGARQKVMEPASDRFAGGNVLIYRVGGERYGCPLSAVREVIDLPADESDPLLFEGRAIRVASLGAILGMDERGPVTEVRSVLVVAAATSGDDGSADGKEASSSLEVHDWLGFGVGGVDGMISVDALYRVPDGITELPDGTILGAFLLGEETRPKPGTSPDGTGTPQTAQPDVRRWLADDRIRPEALTAETADDQAEEWSEIVLTLDLVRLATEISRVEGR